MAASYSPKMPPLSPTLTNPDMILPYDQLSRASTPSPPPQALRHFVPLEVDVLGAHHPRVHTAGRPLKHRLSAAQLFAQGAPLSHLTEVNSDKMDGQSRKGSFGGSAVYAHPPASNTSWLTAPSEHGADPYSLDGPTPPDMLAHRHLDLDADDRLSVTVFEGEDEPRLSHEDDRSGGYEDQWRMASNQGRRLSGASGTLASSFVLSAPDGEDGQSSVALSKQAERILASAKRKLDKMEGNLSRARHSLMMSPSPSPSPSLSSNSYAPAPRSTPPGMGDVDGYPHTTPGNLSHGSQRRSSPRRSMSGHMRVVSETSVPTSSDRLQESQGHDTGRARAYTTVGTSYHTEPRMAHPEGEEVTPLTAPSMRADPQPGPVGRRNYFSSFLAYSRPLPTSFPSDLKPVREGDTSSTVGLGVDGLSISEPETSPDSRNSVYTSHDLRLLTRSRSAVPIREVRDQMEDLKGRISSLQQQAKEDKLKRRSLQSLRTPSPFTAAEQWYLTVDGYNEGGLSASAGVGRTDRWGGDPYSIGTGIGLANGEEALEEVRYEDTDGENLLQRSSIEGHGADPEEGGIQMADEYFSASEGQYAMGEDSETDEMPGQSRNLDSTSEAFPSDNDPLLAGERHEDRADAFDYGHFFLHSSLGNYSQTDLSRRDSYVSNDSTTSAETARPTQPGNEQVGDSEHADPMASLQRPMQGRKISVDSLSTVATFATATEGDEEVDGVYPEDNDLDPDDFDLSNALPGSFPSSTVDLNAVEVIPDDEVEVEKRSGGSHTPTQEATDFFSDVQPSHDRYLDEEDTFALTSTPKNDFHVFPNPPESLDSWPLTDSNPVFAPVHRPRPLSILLSTITGGLPSNQPTTAFHSSRLASEDRALVVRLMENLGQVCLQLQSMNDQTRSLEQHDLWRTRLLEASRILDGS